MGKIARGLAVQATAPSLFVDLVVFVYSFLISDIFTEVRRHSAGCVCVWEGGSWDREGRGWKTEMRKARGFFG